MARKKAAGTSGAGLGCLGTLLAMGAVGHACTSLCSPKASTSDVAASVAAAEQDRIARQRRIAAEEREKAAREHQEAVERAALLADVRTWTPARRMQAVANCYDEKKVCEPPVALIMEAASTDVERRVLMAADGKYGAARTRRDTARVTAAQAQERAAQAREQAAEARAGSAPLLCCDGTASPSCTCGGPRRGCCSHHRGVCGCMN